MRSLAPPSAGPLTYAPAQTAIGGEPSTAVQIGIIPGVRCPKSGHTPVVGAFRASVPASRKPVLDATRSTPRARPLGPMWPPSCREGRADRQGFRREVLPLQACRRRGQSESAPQERSHRVGPFGTAQVTRTGMQLRTTHRRRCQAGSKGISRAFRPASGISGDVPRHSGQAVGDHRMGYTVGLPVAEGRSGIDEEALADWLIARLAEVVWGFPETQDERTDAVLKEISDFVEAMARKKIL